MLETAVRDFASVTLKSPFHFVGEGMNIVTTGKNRSYLLITPVKNEAEHVKRCISSVAKQNILPAVWVMVDDGSSDGSKEIVEKASVTYQWILPLFLEDIGRNLNEHVYEVYITGIHSAIEHCEKQGIEWKFIAVLDADMWVFETYFEDLIKKFEEIENLGIASGTLFSYHNRRYLSEEHRNNLPWGGGRMWRKSCYEDAPYLPVYSGDSVSTIKANLKGWDTLIFNDILLFQRRLMGSAQGHSTGAQTMGEASYFLGSPISFAILKMIKLTMQYPYYHGLWYIFGYLKSYVRKRKKIDDIDILNHYEKKLKEWMQNYINRKK